MTYGLEPPDDRDSATSHRSGLSPHAALEDLRRRLVRYATKLIWNRADAEELVQEAFKVAASKGKAMDETTFEPWMFRTTGNLGMNLARRRRPEALADWSQPAQGRTPVESAIDIERIERLRAGIERLPAQQRIAVTLRCIEQFDYSKVADIMEITESAVRAHVHQGRRRLAEALRDMNHA